MPSCVALFAAHGPQPAKPVLVEALAMRRQLYGDRHSDVAACLRLLSSAETSLGNWPQAVELLREALAIDQHLHGEVASERSL